MEWQVIAAGRVLPRLTTLSCVPGMGVLHPGHSLSPRQPAVVNYSSSTYVGPGKSIR